MKKFRNCFLYVAGITCTIVLGYLNTFESGFNPFLIFGMATMICVASFGAYLETNKD